MSASAIIFDERADSFRVCSGGVAIGKLVEQLILGTPTRPQKADLIANPSAVLEPRLALLDPCAARLTFARPHIQPPAC